MEPAIIFLVNVIAHPASLDHSVMKRAQMESTERNANKNANARIVENVIHKAENANVHQVRPEFDFGKSIKFARERIENDQCYFKYRLFIFFRLDRRCMRKSLPERFLWTKL